jgi:hypothetical protein
MLLIALSCLFKPCVTAMSVYVLTPFPPAHDHVVFHATVLPLALVTCAQSEPLAPEMPHWSSCSVYGPAAAVSHCPQCCVVSSAGVGAPSAAVHSEARRASLANMVVRGMTVEGGHVGWPARSALSFISAADSSGPGAEATWTTWSGRAVPE